MGFRIVLTLYKLHLCFDDYWRCVEIGSFNGKINDLVEVLEQHAVRIDEQKLRVSACFCVMMSVYLCEMKCLVLIFVTCICIFMHVYWIFLLMFCAYLFSHTLVCIIYKYNMYL